MRGEHLQSRWKLRDGNVGDLECLVLDEWQVSFILKNWLCIQEYVDNVIPECSGSSSGYLKCKRRESALVKHAFPIEMTYRKVDSAKALVVGIAVRYTNERF